MESTEGAAIGPIRVPLAEVTQGLAAERLADVPSEVVTRLLACGLSVPVEGMFVTSGSLLLDVRTVNGMKYRLLGLSDSIGGSPYLLAVSGDVMILDADEGQLRFVNSSLDSFLVFMERWDSFISLDSVDEDAGIKLGRKMKRDLKRVDKNAFKDEERWWACVFEDVEYGILGPG